MRLLEVLQARPGAPQVALRGPEAGLMQLCKVGKEQPVVVGQGAQGAAGRVAIGPGLGGVGQALKYRGALGGSAATAAL